MDKKSILIIFLILIILCIGVFSYFQFSNQETVFKVGDTKFTMPEGYALGSLNKYGAVNITNGENSIFLVEYNDTNVTNIINDYKKLIEKQNQTLHISELKSGDVVIYKTDNIDTPDVTRYWFVKNNKSYAIYKWDKNNDMDAIVLNLYNSAKLS